MGASRVPGSQEGNKWECGTLDCPVLFPSTGAPCPSLLFQELVRTDLEASTPNTTPHFLLGQHPGASVTFRDSELLGILNSHNVYTPSDTSPQSVRCGVVPKPSE